MKVMLYMNPVMLSHFSGIAAAFHSYERMPRLARRKAERHDIGAVAKRLRKFYEGILTA